jgi:hypothetical protein
VIYIDGFFGLHLAENCGFLGTNSQYKKAKFLLCGEGCATLSEEHGQPVFVGKYSGSDE